MPIDPFHISRVVVAFDGSEPSHTALRLGTEFAVARGADLLLVCAVEVSIDPTWTGAFGETAHKALTTAARTAAATLDEARVSQLVRTGHAPTALLEITRPGDLLVTGTHGHRPVVGVLLGSTSSSLITHAHCPVLVARPTTIAASAPVVVGVDGSRAAHGALRMAADEADRLRVPLRAIAAVPPVIDAAGMVSGPDDATLRAAESRLAEAVAGLRQDRPDLVIDMVVSQTHPVETLLRASHDAGLLVLGSRGRGPIKSALLGSVSRDVAQRAACSVLVVRPFDNAASSEIHQRHDAMSSS